MYKLTKTVFIIFLLISTCYAGSKEQPLDQVVAVVNDEVITKSELQQEMATAKKELRASNTPIPANPALEKQVLNQMIDKKIELQMAKRFGIDITQDELNKSINKIAKRNHASTASLRKMVISQGIDWSDYRQQIKDQMLIQKTIQRAVGSHIDISDQEIKNVMDSPAYANKNISNYHVGDILISLPDEPTSKELHDAYKKADHIMAELKKGKNFKALAAEDSNSDSALSGGDLGWKPLEELPTMFADKIQTMQSGQLAGPIRTGNGLHIIKLLGIKEKNNKHYMTKTHVRHILIPVKMPSESNEAKRQAISIRNKLTHGGDFNQLAKEYSKDPGSASKGGDLGWVSPGILVPPFENAMNNLKVHQISQPIQTSYGWHIIEVLGRKKVDDSKAHQKAQIRKMIYQRKYKEQAQNWVERMKDASYVKVMLDDNA